MKISKRKRYRILTASAELVSVWFHRKALCVELAAEKDTRLYFFSWPLGAEFAFNWTKYREDHADPNDPFNQPDSELTPENFMDFISRPDPFKDAIIQWEDAPRASIPQIGRLICFVQGAGRITSGLWEDFVREGTLEQCILRIETLLKSNPDLSSDPAPPVKG